MEDVKITFVGHATNLIQSGRFSLITDPVFSENILFVKRANKPGINPADLPDLTCILLSHTHIDHLDFASFNYFKTTIPIVVPEGSSKVLRSHLPNPVIELAGWSAHQFDDGLKINAVPVNHPSSIYCPYRFKKAAGYIIDINGKIIFFAGDTSYTSVFKDIGNMYNIDAALLPIGCYKPEFYMKRHHMDPTEAVQAFVDLKAKSMIPIHWGTFRLSLEKLSEPIEKLKKVTAERELGEKVKILEPGESVTI